jgi:hypothetical protein
MGDVLVVEVEVEGGVALDQGGVVPAAVGGERAEEGVEVVVVGLLGVAYVAIEGGEGGVVAEADPGAVGAEPEGGAPVEEGGVGGAGGEAEDGFESPVGGGGSGGHAGGRGNGKTPAGAFVAVIACAVPDGGGGAGAVVVGGIAAIGRIEGAELLVEGGGCKGGAAPPGPDVGREGFNGEVVNEEPAGAAGGVGEAGDEELVELGVGGRGRRWGPRERWPHCRSQSDRCCCCGCTRPWRR